MVQLPALIVARKSMSCMSGRKSRSGTGCCKTRTLPSLQGIQVLTLARWGVAAQCRVSLCLEQSPDKGATELYYELSTRSKISAWRMRRYAHGEYRRHDKH